MSLSRLKIGCSQSRETVPIRKRIQANKSHSCRLLEQVVPVEGGDDDNESVASGPRRIEQPPFSLATMGNNFRRFNARYDAA